jgi:antitoxin FitA
LVSRQGLGIIGLGWSVAMTVSLSIENAPEDVVERLRRRAERHGRSLGNEILAIIETATREDQQFTAKELLVEVRRLGLNTPREATAMMRADRNGR